MNVCVFFSLVTTKGNVRVYKNTRPQCFEHVVVLVVREDDA